MLSCELVYVLSSGKEIVQGKEEEAQDWGSMKYTGFNWLKPYTQTDIQPQTWCIYRLSLKFCRRAADFNKKLRELLSHAEV